MEKWTRIRNDVWEYNYSPNVSVLLYPDALSSNVWYVQLSINRAAENALDSFHYGKKFTIHADEELPGDTDTMKATAVRITNMHLNAIRSALTNPLD